jgi:hypothetical protein
MQADGTCRCPIRDDYRVTVRAHTRLLMSHRLRFVELRVLEGRQADQTAGQRLRELRLVEVEKVCHGHGWRFR